VKQILLNNIKNIWGWKTSRKIVVLSVDDYGNVRLDSSSARKEMDKAGLKVLSRFDAYDTLETREDLEMLYETLSSVKDKNGNHAVFTPFALPCNIDFEKMMATNFEKYQYELLPETYNKLSAKDARAYEGTWKLWEEGIDSRLMVPQFHGREHFNLKVFEEKIANRDFEVLTALRNRSYASISKSGYSSINVTAAFDFCDFDENKRIKDILTDGLNRFEEVYGYRSINFMPPTSKIHPSHFPLLFQEGVKFIDTAIFQKQHQGAGVYSKTLSFTGKKLSTGQINLVRNVVFEPTNNSSVNSVDLAMTQIETAFRWKRPAIISSHRVNFCGHIDAKNRILGITALKQLLNKIVTKWPDVEFMAANELGRLMEK
jgi:hypothetical protein